MSEWDVYRHGERLRHETTFGTYITRTEYLPLEPEVADTETHLRCPDCRERLPIAVTYGAPTPAGPDAVTLPISVDPEALAETVRTQDQLDA